MTSSSGYFSAKKADVREKYISFCETKNFVKKVSDSMLRAVLDLGKEMYENEEFKNNV